jgi:ABC-2 type transport system ATP-binding protein
MIVTQGLTRWYGDFLALDSLDLELAEGDLFGFIGPNGAGKTTTMKILATLLDPTEGRAFVGGIDVVKEPKKVRRLVGYMPDFFGVYREMRVAEYLAFFAAAYRVSRRDQRRVVGDLLELVDLAHKSEETVGALSRGMQQRLGLARALVHDPKVLILDEPASGLDPRARVEVREILLELSRMGKTILLSSHILPELSSVCNRIGIIARGSLLALGSVDEVAASVAAPALHIRLGDLPEDADPQSLLHACLAHEVTWNQDAAVWSVEAGGEEALTPEDAARAIVGAGLPLRYLHPVQASLEEVFLRLTEDLDLGSEGEDAA